MNRHGTRSLFAAAAVAIAIAAGLMLAEFSTERRSATLYTPIAAGDGHLSAASTQELNTSPHEPRRESLIPKGSDSSPSDRLGIIIAFQWSKLGTPVRGATLQLQCLRCGKGALCMETSTGISDELGRSTFIVGHEGRYGVECWHAHAAPPQVKREILITSTDRYFMLQLSQEAELTYAGRVVDAGLDQGVPSAEVLLCLVAIDGPAIVAHRARTDGAGYFAFTVPPSPLHLLKVRAEGFAEGMAWPEPASEEAIIRLERSATLEVTIAQGDTSPAAGAVVLLRTSSSGQIQNAPTGSLLPQLLGFQEWSRTADEKGRCQFVGLPVGVVLQPVLRQTATSMPLAMPAFVLKAAETRQLYWDICSDARILGALEAGFTARANRELWLVAADSVDTRLTRMFRPFEEPAAKTRTDEFGAFLFLGVPRGHWWIGLAPRESVPEEALIQETRGPTFVSRVYIVPEGSPAFAESKVQDVMPMASRVFVDCGDVIRAEITARQGLTMRGMVVGPQGSVSGASVGILGTDVGGMSGDDGEFVLAPVDVVGTLIVDARDRNLCREIVQYTQGSIAQGIVCELHEGGTIIGTASGLSGMNGQATIVHAGAGRFDGRLSASVVDGNFQVHGLCPGEYLVWVKADGLGCVDRISVRPSEASNIVMHAGPTGVVAFTADDHTTVEILYGGIGMSRVDVVAGAESLIALPLGEYKLLWVDTLGSSKAKTILVDDQSHEVIAIQ
jgi:hypothetical protein